MKYLNVNKHNGINRFANRNNMPANWVWDLLNCYLDKENNIQQRNGLTKFNASPINKWSAQYLCDVEPDAATPAWTLAGTDYSSVSSRVLTIDTTGGSARSCSYSIAWGADNSTGWSIQFEMKVDTAASADQRLIFHFDDGTYYESLRFSTAGILLFVDGGTHAMDTTDDYHIYRITGKGTVVKVYVDDMTTPVITGTLATGTVTDWMYFGDTSAGAGINSKSNWKYIKSDITGDSLSTATTKTLFEAKWDDGSKTMIARADDTWFKEDADAVWDAIDYGRTSDAAGQCTMMLNQLLMADGGTLRVASSAFAVADVTDIPIADSTAIHIHNHHAITNSTANPLKIYISALNSITDWSTANDALTLDLRTYIDGGDTVVGFGTFGEDQLIILMKKHVVIYNAPTDTLDWSLDQIIATGTVSNNATATKGGHLFFPGLEGVNTLATLTQIDEGGVSDMTRQVAPFYRELLSQTTSTNWGNINGCLSRSKNHYYVSFPNATNKDILVYSFDLMAIVGRFQYKYSGSADEIYSMAEREDGTILLGGDNGYVYTMGSGTDDSGTAITMEVATPYYYFTSEESYKVVRDLQVVVEHTGAMTFTIDYRWDGQAADTQISKTLAATSVGRTIVKEEGVLGRGHSIYFKFAHSTADEIIDIPRYSFGVLEEGTK